MKILEILIKAETVRLKANFCYQLLGEFGEELPEKLQDNIRKKAEDFIVESEKYKIKAKNTL